MISMNKNQIQQIALEIFQYGTLVLTVITAIPATQAPTWVPIVSGIVVGLVSWAKQILGNTPQNVPGSTAAAVASGAIVATPVVQLTQVAPAPAPVPSPVGIVHPAAPVTPVYPQL